MGSPRNPSKHQPFPPIHSAWDELEVRSIQVPSFLLMTRQPVLSAFNDVYPPGINVP